MCLCNLSKVCLRAHSSIYFILILHKVVVMTNLHATRPVVDHGVLLIQVKYGEKAA